MKGNKLTGHLFAIFSIVVWGTTFISTKVLLQDFSALTILLTRFIIGYIALIFMCPKHYRFTSIREELYFAGSGLCGVTLYYLTENFSLVYSTASNVGVIVSAAPFFTAILAHFFISGERLNKNFILGFIVSLCGIALINFNGQTTLSLNPLGDILALTAAAVWGIYSVLSVKTCTFSCTTIEATRRMFFYGLIFMIPTTFIFPYELKMSALLDPVNIFNLIFLGLGASALCFITWNTSVKILGAVKTSVYIYLSPVVTVITSVIVLNEKVTPLALIGTLLTLSGLIVSEYKKVKESREALS